MRDRSLRVSLAFFLLFVLPVAPALHAYPLESAATASLEAPFDFFAGVLDRLTDWLGLREARPEPRIIVAPDGTGGNPPLPLGDDGTCLNPDGHRVPCTP